MARRGVPAAGGASTALPVGGRPRVGTAEAVVEALQEVSRTGQEEITVPDVVQALMRRVPCSRRTAYRAINRACEEGKAHISGF